MLNGIDGQNTGDAALFDSQTTSDVGPIDDSSTSGDQETVLTDEEQLLYDRTKKVVAVVAPETPEASDTLSRRKELLALSLAFVVAVHSLFRPGDKR